MVASSPLGVSLPNMPMSLTGSTSAGSGLGGANSLMGSLSGANTSLSGLPSGASLSNPMSVGGTDLSNLGLSGSIGQMMSQISTMMTQLMTIITSLVQQIQSDIANKSPNALGSGGSSLGTSQSAGDGSSGSSGISSGSTSSGSTSSGSTSSGSGDQGSTPTNGNLHGITPNQFQIGDPDQGSMCGIVAAKAFANAAGKNISIEDIKKIAVQHNLWDAGNGMHGPESENQLMSLIGLNTTETNSIDWNKVKQQVQSGHPVVIDTPQHYFVIEGYDPTTGKFDFGNSARILKASGGQTQYTPEELSAKFGSNYTPRAAIFLNN